MTHLPPQLLLLLAILWQRFRAGFAEAFLIAISPLAVIVIFLRATATRALAPPLLLWQRAGPHRRRIAALVFTGESTSAEWTSAGFSTVLAVVLCLSTTTFETSPIYDQLAWMEEQGWGIIFAAHAGLTITAYCKDDHRGRRIGLLCSTVLWFTWLAMLVKGTPQTTGWVYLVPALASAIGYMRLVQATRR